MKAAIYSRKSKFTGKGESVENQVQLCKEHLNKMFNIKDEDIYIFEDEGFTGGNTRRPEFQNMIKHAKLKKFELLVCYRLDRISRNVSDFAYLINDLNKHNVNFISLREQFDTTTPMGRAMMYIASVFSQLERETIAERIRDNMLQLAKTGRWLGGTPPTGFESEEVINPSSSGKEKKMFKLSPLAKEIEVVKLIYNKYIELKSMTKVEEYLINNNIYTKNGVNFSRYSIKFILDNPVYVVADKAIFDFLKENEYDVCSSFEEFNGINGLIGYNRTNQVKEVGGSRVRENNEWIIAVGMHEGIISSSIWIKAQELLMQNKSKTYRKARSSLSLLSGILRCEKCGSYMRPKVTTRINSDGEQVFYYICELKEKSKKKKCDNLNINGNTLDELIVNELKSISAKTSPIFDDIISKKSLVDESKENLHSEIDIMKSSIDDVEKNIRNIVLAIEKGQTDEVLNNMLKRMEELCKEKTELQNKLTELQDDEKAIQFKEFNFDIILESLSTFNGDTWELMENDNKRKVIRGVVDRIAWDGNKIDIILFGNKTIEMSEKDPPEQPGELINGKMFPEREYRK